MAMTRDDLQAKASELLGRVARAEAMGDHDRAGQYERELRGVWASLARMDSATGPSMTDRPTVGTDGATGTADAPAGRPADESTTRPELIREGNRMLAAARGAATAESRAAAIGEARRLFARAGDTGMVRYCDRWIAVDAPARADAKAAVLAYDPTARLYHDHTETDPAERYVILTDGDVLGAGPTAAAAWRDAAAELASLSGRAG